MSRQQSGNTPEWEALCQRCGRCCYEKVDFEGQVYYTQMPCEFLDIATRQCKVYSERFRRRHGCVPLSPENLKAGVLPADCPYVQEIEDYKAPLVDEQVEE
jgi:uncharacterized cysteine cluster protein YcgN (CxxCxxCC family)